MKHLKMLLTVLLLGLLGCSDGDLVGVELEEDLLLTQQALEGASAAKRTLKYVPYQERASLAPTTDPRADLGMVCGPGEFEIFNRRDGQASHLGSFIGFDNSCANTAISQVRMRGVNFGANGDSFTYEALCLFISPVDFVCDLTVTGGTGRFENASTPPGEPIIVEGVFDVPTQSAELEASGRISSVGSSK